MSASNSAVSVVLVQEKEEEGKLKQIPVYFASEALSSSKIFYSELGKIAYAVIMAARKLRHYFEGHRIRVITRDESGTDIIRPTDRPKGSDTQMVRSYPNPDI
jgi:hypothetical protein